MICLIEPQCIEWQHEMVNAGFLKLVRQSFPNEEIELVAEKQHINIIRKLSGVPLTVEKEIIPPVLNDYISKKNVNYYIDLLKKTICENKDVDRVVLLSSHQCSVEAVAKIAKDCPNVKFVLVVHAILEWAYDYGEISSIGSLKSFKRSAQLYRAFSKASEEQNVSFVTYSPFIDEIKRLYPRKISCKFMFLNHPYPYDDFPEESNKHEGNVIGIMGACMNDYAEDIIQKAQNMSNVDFLPFNKGSRITREDIKSKMCDVDCLLMPYNEMKYRVSASGVLFDALNYDKPIIGMNSPLLRYYNDRFDIGWICDNTDDVVELLRSGWITKEAIEQKREDISKCKLIIDVENNERCKEILSI